MPNTTLSVADITPSNLIVPPLISASSSIIRRTKVEVVPIQNLNFSFSGNNRMEFLIKSSSDFLDGMNSFLRFTLSTAGYYDGSTNDINRRLATGGGHSLFRSIQMKLGNNVNLELIQAYNKYYAANSYATQSELYVNDVEFSAGDSVNAEPSPSVANTQNRLVAGDVWEVIAATGSPGISTLTAVNSTGDALDQLSRGDDLWITDSLNNGAFIYKGNVESISSANAINVSPFINYTATHGSTGAGLIYTDQRPARQLVCNGAGPTGTFNNSNPNNLVAVSTDMTLNLAPMLQLLGMKELLPLAFFQTGILLTFELENPVLSMTLGHAGLAPSSSATANYLISNPRMICEMCTPSEQIKYEYLQLFKENRLAYPFLTTSYIQNSDNGAATTSASYQHNINARSLRYVIATIENVRSNSTQPSSTGFLDPMTYDSIGTLIDGGLQYFQWQDGSDQFPLVRVNCTDQVLAEAFTELRKTYGIQGGTLYDPRFEYSQWAKLNKDSNTGATDESHRFIMSTRFDRTGPFSGYDSSNGGMQFIYTANQYLINGSQGNRYFNFWYVYDSILNIGIDGIGVLN